MLKMKKITLRCIAFAMALALACSGIIDNVYLMSSKITGNLSGAVTAEAATTGTVNADTFSWDNALVYFLLTDRFKNGNPSNDHSYNRGLDQNGNVIPGVDDRGTFHGGDFKGITETIKDGYFNDLGVNAIWISAPYEQIHGYIVGSDATPSFAHYSYHGYYVLDYTNTDANFGTMEEFKELVDTAHEHGIRVIMDVVLNHAGYNSLYDMNEYDFGVLKNGWDSYYFNMKNINNTDYHGYIDYDNNPTQWGKWWGPSWIRAGLPGYTAGNNNDPLTMSLTGLPDFKTESTGTVGIPAFLEKKWKEEGRYDEEVQELQNYLSSHGYQMTVTNCISYWLSTWVRDYGVDGFRCDTAKHVEYGSWKTLKTMCTDALKTWKANNPDKKLDDLDFWMTGEAYGHGVSYDGYYTQGGFDSMINFETSGGNSIESKYSGYASSINTKEDFNVLSYISSHDDKLGRGDMISIGSAFLLLPGGVQIYYGDETNRSLVSGIPFDGNGGAGHSLRSDMNWGSMDEAVLAHWQKVGRFRSSHMAVGAGANAAVSATSGKAYTRTYEKGDVKDRVAFCIGASANTEVTIDISSVWSNGESVVNYYDGSSAVVTNGKVTFNSGANGTILIGDEDGKPQVSFAGEEKFKGTQQVTVSIDGADSAIVSIDSGKKFVVEDGDTFTIGETAYEGDTITISYKATNEKGTVNGKATFYKAYADEDIGGGNGEDEEPGLVRVKMSDGSAPYLYAWSRKDESTDIYYAEGWPGTKLTEKDKEGYYYYELDTTGKYNIIFHNGAGTQTENIMGLRGKVTFEVASGYDTYTQTGGIQDIPIVNNTITIHVKPYSSSSSAPHLYVWSDYGTHNGAFPGDPLTDKDENGDWVFVVDGVASVSCIVDSGNDYEKTGDIEDITGEAWITIESADYTKYSVKKTEKVESKYALMKKEARAIKNMTSGDYTTVSWNNLYQHLALAEKFIALGEEEADTTEVETIYNAIVAAKNDLVLVAPTVTSAQVGSKEVSGIAPCESTVSVKVNGTSYSATADEITGIWTILTDSALANPSTIETSCVRNGLESATGSYTVPITTGTGNVIVKYVDESGKEITKSKTLIGTVGAAYTTMAAEVAGYTVKTAPDNATGIYTEADITVTYVYKKNETPKTGKVIVKYVDESGKVIANTKSLEGTAGTTYTTEKLTVDGYTFKEIQGNATGKYIEGEEITVTYVYEKIKTGTVTVKYVDESGNTISPEITLNGPVGTAYTTEKVTVDGYTFKETQGGSAAGQFTEDPINVTYIYKKNDIPVGKGTVTVKYVDESGKVIANTKSLEGTAGTTYTTEKLTVDGYTFKEIQGNATGKYIEGEEITVTYVYEKVKTGTVTVRYEDESGNTISPEITLNGPVGTAYTTEKITVDGYTFKETQGGSAAGQFTVDPINVTYIYKKNDIPVGKGTVTVKYVDEAGNVIANTKSLEGSVGTTYTTEKLTVDGYIFKEIQGNATGTFIAGNITVTYIYEKAGKVTIRYIDESGAKRGDPQTMFGKVGDAYATTAIDVEGYTLKTKPANAEGTYTEQDITVTYVYKKNTTPDPKPPVTTGETGKVIVKYVDESGKAVATQKTLTGKVGAAYTTTAVTAAGYTLKTTPANAKGTYTKADITVTYVYKKNSTTSTTVKVDKTFRKMLARVIKTTKTSNKLKWSKVKGADGYIIYGAAANKKVKKLKDQKTTTYTHKKLKKGTYYKYEVKAYKVIDGKKVVIATSKTAYSTTDGGKYGNAKKIKVNKASVKLKKGGKFTIKASAVKANRKIKTYRKLTYESSNTKVATVSKKGVIKAKKKGTCTIYVYTQNGVYKKIKVTVK